MGHIIRVIGPKVIHAVRLIAYSVLKAFLTQPTHVGKAQHVTVIWRELLGHFAQPGQIELHDQMD